MATIVLKLRGRELSRHPIQSRITRIGRELSNDIAIDNPGVSRMHASVRYQGGHFIVVDEGSANGIFINGDEVDTCELKDGDEVQFGKFTALFLAEGGVAPHRLLDQGTGDSEPVNPVETTSISTDDIRRMIAQRQPGQQPSPPDLPPQRPASGDERFQYRHAHTYTEAPSRSDAPTPAREPASDNKGQQMLMVAVGGLGVMVLVLAGLVVYLLMRG